MESETVTNEQTVMEPFSVLYHAERWYRRLFVDIRHGANNTYNTYEIETIHFYDDDGNTLISFDYFNDDRDFTYDGETRLRRKLNFNRKENFIIKSDSNWSNDRRYDLYIYYRNTNLKYLGKEIKNEYHYNSDEVMWSYIYKKYSVDDYIHRTSIKSLSRKKSRLQGKYEDIVKKELYNSYVVHTKPDDEMKKVLKKLYKLNQRINKENERLILREKLQR